MVWTQPNMNRRFITTPTASGALGTVPALLNAYIRQMIKNATHPLIKLDYTQPTLASGFVERNGRGNCILSRCLP
jgi:hypothetical protein